MRQRISFTAALIALFIAVAAPPAAAVAANRGPLIAPASACPGQSRPRAPVEAQERAMLCMADFARDRAGLDPFATVRALNRSARRKSRDILRCGDFSHFACDREFTYWVRKTGYLSVPCWHVGENIAWGIGRFGTVRSLFRAWMRSPSHRANILGDYEEIGIGMRVGVLVGSGGARVWTQHFGSHCEGP